MRYGLRYFAPTGYSARFIQHAAWIRFWPSNNLPAAPDGDSPVEGLSRFERPDSGDDDFRHRMWMNVLAFGFLVLLVGGGIWMADNMATMRKNQDCVLSGRRGCNQFEAPAAGSLTPSTAKIAPASN
jgi:hypothetical protein